MRGRGARGGGTLPGTGWSMKEEKATCRATEYNPSHRNRCEQRVITMTHGCNPFKTHWRPPRLLGLPLQWRLPSRRRLASNLQTTISEKCVSCLLVHLLRLSPDRLAPPPGRVARPESESGGNNPINPRERITLRQNLTHAHLFARPDTCNLSEGVISTRDPSLDYLSAASPQPPRTQPSVTRPADLH
jgi:hypothetical protein